MTDATADPEPGATLARRPGPRTRRPTLPHRRAADDAEPEVGGLRGARRALVEHPVGTVAALAAIIAAVNLWWVHEHRFLGTFDVDETGYIAAALRYLIDARSVTGQMIAVDGGQHLGWKTPDIVAP